MVGTYTAAVVGASGYAGAELVRLLLGHPNIELEILAGSPSRVGTSIAEYLPNLIGLEGRTFDAVRPEDLDGVDIVFTALPHGESGTLVPQLEMTQKIIDLGADFRLESEQAWNTYYDTLHAGTWTYGLPELPGARTAIELSQFVANPGCYATAIQLALAPLLANDLIEPNDIVVVAASGTSGAGRKATDSLLASNVMGSMSAYKVGGLHQHTPEIEQQLSALAKQPVTLNFTPLLAPMSRGILAAVTATVWSEVDAKQLRAAFEKAYAAEPFVFLLPGTQQPQTSSVYGTNACQLQVAYDAHSSRVVVTSVIDNLGKGAAGQAVQNANLVLGLPETTGLTVLGVAP